MSEVSVEAVSRNAPAQDLQMDSPEEVQNTEDIQIQCEDDNYSSDSAEYIPDDEVPLDDEADVGSNSVVQNNSNIAENIDGCQSDNVQSKGDVTENCVNAVHDGVSNICGTARFDGVSAQNENYPSVTTDNKTPKEHDTQKEPEDSHTHTKEIAMAEEVHSPAAEISVTSNGDLEESHEDVFRDPSHSVPGGLNLSESHVSSGNFASTTEGIIESGPFTGTMQGQPLSGPVVLADDLKNPAMEKLDLVRKWSINTYKCTRQILSEKLGRGSRTVDLELEGQIEVLRENKRKYEQVVKLAQTLASQLTQIMQTQRQLGDAFADLSLKSPELHEEFGYNADTQKLLSKNGETLLGAINFFIASVNTLVDKTIEDTMINIKQYETARIEYDAYRTDLEELNLGPRDATTLPKIEHSQQQFQIYREKYEKMRNDVSIKLKFLEENKVKVLHNQLILFHNAIAAYYAGNQQQLEQTLKQFHIKLKMPGGDMPSWLEEH
ncbi:arfaptin-1 isoform X2 [Esox lucius]|uniref:AH domain-containing protein n=1 Tax=Esox lucius TaxID=8010 RepID=A0A3P8XGX2_ESOLU|nr:arfaptin-1 isoform X2 [Esox lucius]